VQVQRWLGHHSPSFTLDTYVHLLDADLGEPLLPTESANRVQTDPTPLDDNGNTPPSPEMQDLQPYSGLSATS